MLLNKKYQSVRKENMLLKAENEKLKAEVKQWQDKWIETNKLYSDTLFDLNDALHSACEAKLHEIKIRKYVVQQHLKQN